MKKVSTKYNAAIIGCCGISGLYDLNFFKRDEKFAITHAAAYFMHKDIELVGVCDNNSHQLKKFSEFWKIEPEKCFSNVGKMLAKQVPDLVSICTPTETHAEIIHLLVNAGVKGIFCEKPLTHDFKSAKDILTICNNNNVKLVTNYFRRWNYSLQVLQTDIKNKTHGEFIRGFFFFTKGVIGNASHLMDLANWFFGYPEDVRLNHVYKEDLPYLEADFSFHYSNGSKIDFMQIQNNNSYIFIECELFFENAVISIQQRGQFICIRKKISDQIYDGFHVLNQDLPIETDWKNAPLEALNELILAIERDAYIDDKLGDSLEELSQIECIISQLKRMQI